MTTIRLFRYNWKPFDLRFYKISFEPVTENLRPFAQHAYSTNMFQRFNSHLYGSVSCLMATDESIKMCEDATFYADFFR